MNTQDEEESQTLKSLVGEDSSVQEFLDRVWQKECRIFRHHADDASKQASSDDAAMKNEEETPLTNLVDNAWDSLISLLHEARERYNPNESLLEKQDDDTSAMVPILFRNGHSISPDQYDFNLFHAYLDGCSVVINHADWSCANVARVCLDLQRTFPHSYANTYLTPPASQAVPPHADDRDVFVIQLLGKKQWKVYETVPIPYPYPNEQVGKAGLDVPQSVLNGPFLYDTTLEPGDVLYMPRGHVHQARTLDDEYSFHVTIALPTQDWTLAGAITRATQQTLSQVLYNRMALPLSLITENTNAGTTSANADADSVRMAQQQLLDEAMTRIQEQVTLDVILQDLKTKTSQHNERALQERLKILQQHEATHTNNNNSKTSIIGKEAAALLTLDSFIRASTPEEKATIELKQPRGLHVREDTASALMGILQSLKADPSRTCKVSELLSLLEKKDEMSTPAANKICQLTLFSFAQCSVELGGMTIVI